MSPANNLGKQFFKNWGAVEALPIVTIVAFVTTGGSWALYRSAMGPTIQWTKANPTPWNEVKPLQTTKILDPAGNFNSNHWSRDRL